MQAEIKGRLVTLTIYESARIYVSYVYASRTGCIAYAIMNFARIDGDERRTTAAVIKL